MLTPVTHSNATKMSELKLIRGLQLNPVVHSLARMRHPCNLSNELKKDKHFQLSSCTLSLTESYVADEIITSRAKKRIRVGNTDAEGRMAMADPLCEMKEKVRDILVVISLPSTDRVANSLSTRPGRKTLSDILQDT